MTKTLGLLVLFIFTIPASANPVIGNWVTYDDDGEVMKSTVQLYIKDDKLFGKVIKIHDTSSGEDTCIKCSGDKKDQPILGLEIISDMELSKDRWRDGEILDPENGKTYDCKIWLKDDNTLMVRGYIGFFYRTQTWLREGDN